MAAPPQRILIIKPSSLGDVATALPLAVDLKHAFPDAMIDWLIHPALRDLVRDHWAIRQNIDFDRKRLGAWWFHPAAAALLAHLLTTLRQTRYDVVIDAQGLLRSGLLTAATRAPMRIGFANAREGARYFYTHRVSLPATPQIAVLRMRALLQPLDLHPHTPARADIPVRAEAHDAIARCIGDTSPVVVIPGARWDTKRWPLPRFIEIIRRLRAAGEPVVLAGSPDEAPLCAHIMTELPSSGLITLAGQTTLAEMVALLAQAKLVIGNDSGPLHVAVALERPVVGLYGPTDPHHVGPYGQLDHVVRFPVECHPCRRKTCDHHRCMAGLTVEAVWDKVRAVLAASPAAPAGR